MLTDTPKGYKAVKKVEELFYKKGQEMLIDEVTIKCSKEKDERKPTQLLIHSESLQAGPVNIHFYYKKGGNRRCQSN